MQNDDYKKNIDEEVSVLVENYYSELEPKHKHKIKSLIVSKMVPIVRRIASTIARRAYDPIEDLVQAGFIGVLKAIDNFNCEKCNNFRVYAGYLIIGEMKHYVRDKLHTIRIPRHIQELTIRINNFISTLTPEEVYNLTSDYVAEALHVSPKAVDYAMQADRRGQTLSLDEIYATDNENLSYEEIIGNSNYKEHINIHDAKIRLDEIIEILPPEKRVLIDLFYNQDMSKKEIAEQMAMPIKKVIKELSEAFKIMHKHYAESTDSQFIIDKKQGKRL